MAISIKSNDKGLYKLISTVSDEQLHDEDWISENDVKKILIERHFMSFIEKAVEIDMEFPNHYFIDDKYVHIKDKPSFSHYIIKLMDENNYVEIYNEFNKIVDKVKLNIPKFE